MHERAVGHSGEGWVRWPQQVTLLHRRIVLPQPCLRNGCGWSCDPVYSPTAANNADAVDLRVPLAILQLLFGRTWAKWSSA